MKCKPQGEMFYKEMAEKMADIDEETRKKYTRGFYDADQVDKKATGEALKDVTVFDLIAALHSLCTLVSFISFCVLIIFMIVPWIMFIELADLN